MAKGEKSYITIKSTSIVSIFAIAFLVLPDTCVTGDFAAQLSALVYLQEGLTTNLNTIPGIDLSDLSICKSQHEIFYPIGPVYAIHSLASTGLDIASCLKLLTLLSYIFGMLFILSFLSRLGIHKSVLISTAIILCLSCIFKKGINPFVLNTADIFSFAILSGGMLWAFVLISSNSEHQRSRRFILQLLACSFVLGTIYFVKYSQFVYAVPIFLSLIICLFINRENILISAAITALCTILFLSTFITVNIYTYSEFKTGALDFTMGNYINNSPYVINYYGEFYAEASSGKLLAISTLSGLGWLNFGFPFFSDAVYLLLENDSFVSFCTKTLHINANVVLTSIFGFFITLLLIVIAYRYAKFLSINQIVFFSLLAIIPIVILTINSTKVGYNRLVSHEGRFGLPFNVLLEALLFAYIGNSFFTKTRIVFSCVLSLIFIAYPISRGFVALNTYQALDQSSENTGFSFIYPGTFSENDDQATVQEIAKLSKSSNDLIIVAGTTSINRKKLFCHDQINLSLGRRTLKLKTPKDIELPIYHGLTTSERIRVIVLLHKYFTNENHSPCRDDWTMIDSGFAFEPRKRLPTHIRNQALYPKLNPETYLSDLKDRFINAGPITTIQIENSHFTIAYFDLGPNKIEENI